MCDEEIAKDEGSRDENANKTKQNEKPKTTRKKKSNRPVLNAERLMGPRGLAVMNTYMSKIKLSGRATRAKQDYVNLMKGMEMWTQRLYPAGNFDDNLKKIEQLGNSRAVKSYINRIRSGLEDVGGESDSGSDIEVIDELSSPNPPPNTDDNTFSAIISAKPMQPQTSVASTLKRSYVNRIRSRLEDVGGESDLGSDVEVIEELSPPNPPPN